MPDPLTHSLLSLPDARWSRAVANMAELRISRNTCVRSALASRASGGVAPCEGAVLYAALRVSEADCLRFLYGGNAKGFALSFPKAE